MKISTLIDRVNAWRPVRVFTRFSSSGGGILAGGMSYHAFFAVFAALWVGFAIFGVWIGSNDEFAEALYAIINQSVPGLIGPHGVIDPEELHQNDVFTWTGIVALLGLLITALGWLSTTAEAVRAIFGMPRETAFFLLVKLRELVLGLLFGVALIVSALISLASTEALGAVFALFGWAQDSIVFNASVRGIGLLLVLFIDTTTLAVLFRELSRIRIPIRRLITGSLLGAAALGVLKVLGSALLGGASRNPLLATFAVIIGLLIWFNLVSTVTLLAAAWIAVDLEDAGITTRSLSYRKAEILKARREAEAYRKIVEAELQDAQARYQDAPWFARWSAARRLRTAEKRAGELTSEAGAQPASKPGASSK